MVDETQTSRKAAKVAKPRTYLDVPFQEKEQANDLGAKFDRRTKRWYVPPGTDPAPFARWQPNAAPAPRVETGSGRAPAAHEIEPGSWTPDENRLEREAERISTVMDMSIEDARDLVRDQMRRAEEQGAEAARHDFFFEREQLPRPAAVREAGEGGAPSSTPVPETPVRAAPQPSATSDAQLGRAFRDAVQSIATSVTLRGVEVTQTLALSNRLDDIHSVAWRQSGQSSEGDRAIGELIRTRGEGFLGEPLPARAAAALNTLREEAGLPPLAPREPEPVSLRERQEEIDAEHASDFTDPADPPVVERDDRAPAPDSPPPIAPLAAELLIIEARILQASRDEAPRQDGEAHEKTVLWLEALTGTYTAPETRDASVRVASALAEHDGPSSDNPFTNPTLHTAYADHQRMMLARPVTPHEVEVLVEPADATFFDVGVEAERGVTERATPEPAPVDTPGPAVVDVTTMAPAPAANERIKSSANDPDDQAPIATSTVRQTDRTAANEKDARNPANESRRPTLEGVSPAALARAEAARTRDRDAAQRTLRDAAGDRDQATRPAEPAPVAPARGPAPTGAVDPDAGENAIELEASLRKPILSKDGYDLPKALAARYLVKDGRFWPLDARPSSTSDVAGAPHFEDAGPRLKSSNEDRATIADMIAIAQAKNWDSITVKGSETFRRNTWIEASLAGVKVNGFKPGEADQALLAAAKRDRDRLSVSGGPAPAPQPAVAPTAAPKPAAQPSPAPVAGPAVAAAPAPRTTPAPAAGDTPTRQPSVAETRAAMAQALEKLPARTRAEILNRFDARLQAGIEVDERVKRGELKPDQVASALDERSAALRQAWHAPKVAPTAGAQPEQRPAPARTPKVM